MSYILLYLLQGEIVGTFFDSKEKCESARVEWNKSHNPDGAQALIRYQALCVEMVRIVTEKK